MRYLLPLMIVLALIDGAVHFSIDAFVNKTFTNLPYGPLFVALPLGYLVLIALLLRTRSDGSGTHRLVAAALAIYAVIPFVAYFMLTGGRYNPFQLATIAKPLEVVLIVVSLFYVVRLGRQQPVTGTAAVRSVAAK
jgi:cytochrome bd-type quinol oxidase subunit 2